MRRYWMRVVDGDCANDFCVHSEAEQVFPPSHRPPHWHPISAFTHSPSGSLTHFNELRAGVGSANGVGFRRFRRIRPTVYPRCCPGRAGAAVLASVGRQSQHHGAGRGPGRRACGTSNARSILSRMGQGKRRADASQCLP